MLNRFTVERLKDAQEVTGLDFVNQKWTDAGCACGMSQLLIAEKDYTAQEIEKLSELGDVIKTVMRELNVPQLYALGFMLGFDSGEDGSPHPWAKDIYMDGWQDGVAAREAFIDVQS